MTERSADSSPLFTARVAGIFYLLNIVTGTIAPLYLARGLVAVGRPAQLFATICYIVVTLLFYGLFKPVNKSLSLLAALFSLVGCAGTVYSLYHTAPAPIDFILFFGIYCVLVGYLILKSKFLPRTLGVLMTLAGLAWLTFLLPSLLKSLAPWIILPALIGEGSLALWLLMMGVNAQRWKEQADVSGASIGK